MLHLQKGMTVVDATVGGGGHGRMMLAEVSPTGRVIGLEADERALSRFKTAVSSDESLTQASKEGRLVLVGSNYSDLMTVLERLNVPSVDAILADLGFSSDQIEDGARGLSFQQNGPLDMRLDQRTTLTARDIVNTYSEQTLMDMLRAGDETEYRRIAHGIVKEREEQPIETTHQLAELIAEVYPKRKRMTMKIHPATKTFQALRIAVNREFDHLESFLKQALQVLHPGGRLAIITFHSGEDIRVKQFFREVAQGCICPPNFPVCRCGQAPKARILTKRPIVASEREIADNSRARSAKLRVIEKLGEKPS